MNNKEEISLQLFICLLWWLMSSFECTLAEKHQFMSRDLQPSAVSVHLLPFPSAVFTTSVKASLLVT